MRLLKSGLVGSSLLAAGVQVFAQGETRTLWFDIPNTVVYPNTIAPAFPPSNASIGPNGSWSTYSSTQMAARNVDTTTAGLRVPNLGRLFDDLSVPSSSQGILTQIEMVVVAYSLTEFTFTNNTGDPQSGLGASVNAFLDVDNIVSPAPAINSLNPLILVTPGSGPLLGVLQSPTVSGVSLAGVVGATTVVTNSVLTTNTFILNSGTTFDALASQIDAITALPMLFRPTATSSGSGNYSVAAVTYGAAAVGVTYSFVPESDLAWAGLPLVAGGWLIRRRMIAAKKA